MLVHSPSDVFEVASEVLKDCWCHDAAGGSGQHIMTPASRTPAGAGKLDALSSVCESQDILHGEMLASVLCRALSEPSGVISAATPQLSSEDAGPSSVTPPPGSLLTPERTLSFRSVLSYNSKQQAGTYSSLSYQPGPGLSDPAPSDKLPPAGPWDVRSSASSMSSGAAAAPCGGPIRKAASLPTHHRHKRRAVPATSVSLQLDELHQLEQQQMQLQQLHMQAQLQCQAVLERQLLGPGSSFDAASALKQLQYRHQVEQQERQAHAWVLHDLLQQQEAEVHAREAELQATARAAGLSDLVLRELQQQVEAYELQAELLPQQLQHHAFQQQQAYQQQQRRMLGSDAGLDTATKLQRLQAALRRGLLRQSMAAAASQNR